MDILDDRIMIFCGKSQSKCKCDKQTARTSIILTHRLVDEVFYNNYQFDIYNINSAYLAATICGLISFFY